MALDHLPEASGIRVGWNAFKNHLGGAGGQGTVGHISVAGDPTDVSGAPEHIARADVKGPIHRQLGPQQIAAGAVLHALGLTR